MPVTVGNADPNTNVNKPWFMAPDGEHRYTVKKVRIKGDFPEDPDTRRPMDSFVLSPGQLDLPFVEAAEVEFDTDDPPIVAEYDHNLGTVRVDKLSDPETGEERKVDGFEFQIKAYGPPEFRQRNRD